MQVPPDWTQIMSHEKFEQELKLKFAGPGLYLSSNDTMLVTPLPPNNSATKENVWHMKQPDKTLYNVAVWNCNFNETIFAAICTAPTRHDAR